MNNYDKIKESIDNIYRFINRMTDEEKENTLKIAYENNNSTLMYFLLNDTNEKIMDEIIIKQKKNLMYKLFIQDI